MLRWYTVVSWVVCYMVWQHGREDLVEEGNRKMMAMVEVQEKAWTVDKKVKKCEGQVYTRKYLVQLLMHDESELGGGMSDDGTKLAAALRRREKDQALLYAKGVKQLTNVTGEHMWNTLHLAASMGSSSKVVYALGTNHGTESRDKFGWTALHIGAYKGAAPVVAGLLSCMADVFALTNDGWSPLLLAAKSPHDSSREVALLIRTAITARVNRARGLVQHLPESLSILLPGNFTLQTFLAFDKISDLPHYAAVNAAKSFLVYDDVPSKELGMLLFIASGGVRESVPALQARANKWIMNIIKQ